MSAEWRRRDVLPGLAMLCGLMSCGVSRADEETPPDLDFLEYLGSWEESDETWLIFSAEMDEAEAPDSKENVDGKEPAPNGEKLAEFDDEN